MGKGSTVLPASLRILRLVSPENMSSGRLLRLVVAQRELSQRGEVRKYVRVQAAELVVAQRELSQRGEVRKYVRVQAAEVGCCTGRAFSML